jgi:hypothetical protein
MRYMLLICADEKAEAQVPKAEAVYQFSHS